MISASSPKSLSDAISLLKQHGSDAKILAGGQSLIPLMKLRMAAPKRLIDLNGIADLSYIRESDGHRAIGAMTRESELDSSDLIKKKYPIISDTASVIGDPLVRNRATVGGNLAHADPANDLGTYASRSTPVAGAAAAMAARKVRDKARKIAAHLLEVSEDDLVWEVGKFSVKGSRSKSKTIQDCAFAAYTNNPPGMEPGLEAVNYYDPPTLTFPFGSYICVVDIDRGTGQVKIRRFVAVDDCGNIINPMIVEGQIHGGLTMGLAPALYEEINYDADGNIQGGSLMDYLVPTSMETPAWETDKTYTPSPYHPIGAKGVGESATVGAPAAIANAVVDALWHLGVRHIDIPITPPKM